MTNQSTRIRKPLSERPAMLAAIGFVATLALQAWAGPAFAQTRVTGETGGGVAIIPDHAGSNDYRFVPWVTARVQLDHRYLAFEGTTLRLNLLNSPVVEAGPAANWTFKRDPRRIESRAVRALGRIDDAYEVGGFAAVSLNNVATAGDRLRIEATALRDVSDVHRGWTGAARIEYSLPVAPRLQASAAASASYADSDYANTYFGVSAAGAAASGLAAYRPRGGLRDAGVELGLRYAAGRNWAIVGRVGYRRLLGDFADSPIVTREGSANQLDAAIGVTIGF